jgi:hypothetical protein
MDLSSVSGVRRRPMQSPAAEQGVHRRCMNGPAFRAARNGPRKAVRYRALATSTTPDALAAARVAVRLPNRCNDSLRPLFVLAYAQSVLNPSFRGRRMQPLLNWPQPLLHIPDWGNALPVMTAMLPTEQPNLAQPKATDGLASAFSHKGGLRN